MATATEPAKLNPAQASAIVRAELAVARAEATVKKAKRDRAKVRAKYRHLFTPGVAREGSGFVIKLVEVSGQRTFKFAEFLKRHKPTKAMEPFVSQGDDFDRWYVTPIEGPPEP